MNKRIAACVVLAVLTILVLTGCSKPMFNVSGNENNTISVTAKKAPDGSVGISYITVGENEQIAVDAAFEGNGMIRIRMFAGSLGTESFQDEPVCESTISGSDSMSFTIEPGEYTVEVSPVGKVTGTAEIRTEER